MSEANRVQHAFVAETVPGQTPTDPVFQLIAPLSNTLAYNKTTTQSNELRADAQVSQVSVVSADLGGDIAIEWSSETWNEFLAAALRTTPGATMNNGVLTPSFSVEEVFSDVGKYRLWRRMRVNTLSLSAQVDQPVTGSFGFIGTDVEVADDDSGYIGSGSRAPLLGNEPWNAGANLGGILVDGNDIGVCFQQIDLNITNNIRSNKCLGQITTASNPYGTMEITGALRNFFDDWAPLYDAMLAHSDLTLTWTFTGAEGDTTKFSFPRIKVLTDTVNPTGINTDVEDNVTFQALPNASGITMEVLYATS